MSVQTLRLLMLWLLASWQLSWAEPALNTTAPTVAPPDQAEILRQLESAPTRGLLYEISKNGQTAYLFGTIHVGKADFFPLDLVTTRAMVQSSELVVELDATQIEKMQAALQRYAALPKPETLDAALPPALRKRFHAQLDALDMPRASVQGWKPWMATLSLTVGALTKLGYGFEYATEFYFTGMAKELNLPITELEGIDFQFQLFDSIPPRDQLVYLDESLSYLEKGQMQTDTQALVDAWLASDSAALHQLTLKSYQNAPRSARWMQQKLFTERNQRMSREIDKMISGGRTPFVAVGVLHLTGKDGLPALLEKQGYRVTNLYP